MDRILLHQNKYFSIWKGKSHYLEYFTNELGINGSSVLIVNKQRTKILLIKIYRDAIKLAKYECPRGGANSNENSLECAKREGEEETGMKLNIIGSLGYLAPDSGTLASNDLNFIAEAEDENISAEINTDDIILSSKWFSIGEVSDLIKNDEIICGITISLLMKAKIFGYISI